MSKRKRAPHAEEASDNGDDFLTEEDVGIQATQPSQMVDSDHEDNEEEQEDISATQQKSKKIKKRKESSDVLDDEEDGKNLEAGIIEVLKLKNFMCHPSLKVEFHDRTTIIHGENGSGKSAILTAIQVCLGAKAKNTNRGKSIKDLVMTGKEQAEISIQLRNQGKDAYKKHLYGKSITIVKTISKSGSSSLKIQNTRGKTVEKTNEELRQILHSFNIQIDNPTTCMTQDISREFLAGSSEAKKFEFFLKATQLQQMMDSFKHSQESMSKIELILDEKGKSLEESKEELNRRKELYENAEHIDTLNNEIEALKSEKMWAGYLDAKKKHDKELAVLEKKRQDLQQLISQRDSSTNEKLNELNRKKNELEEEKHGINMRLSEIERRVNDLAKTKKDIEYKAQTIYTNRSTHKNEQTICKEQIKILEKEKADTLSKNKIDKESIIREKQEEIEKISAELESYERQKASIEESLTSDKSAKENLTNEYSSVKNEKNQLQYEIRQAETEMQNMQRSRTDKFAVLGGDAMKRFLSDVQANMKKFSKPPVGPIGLILKVKDEYIDWAPCVQHALSKYLYMFIVDNFKDGEELQKLKNKHNLKATHVIQKYSNEIYDVSNNSPMDHLTIFKVLDIDTHSIRHSPVKYDDLQALKATIINTVIDQARIEASVLIEKREDADQYMFGKEPPKFVNDCFTITGTKLIVRGKSKITDTANATRSSLWTKNVEDQINEIDKTIKELSKNIPGFTEKERQIQSEINRINETLKKKNNQIHELNKKIEKCNRYIQDKKKDISDTELDTNDADQQYIQDLNEKIEKHLAKIEQLNEKIHEDDKKIEEIKKQSESLTNQIATTRKEFQDTTRKHDEKNEEILAVLEQIRAVQENSRGFEYRIAQAQRAVADEEKVVGQLAQVMNETRELALVHSNQQEITPSGTVNEISAKISQKKRQLDIEREKLGEMNFAEIKNRYIQYMREYEQKYEAFNCSNQACSIMKTGLAARYQNWRKLKSGNIQTVSHLFDVYMSQKGHSGQIYVDDNSGTLKFDIHMATHGSKVQVADTKSLSGGEKSYTTVSFLLAIWELVDTPFRAVDEFDVFMDSMYRKTAMDLILATAKEKHHSKQLILITPQDVSIVKKDPEFLKIIKLQPPKRDENQRTMDEFMHQHGQ
ncbi:hypothetical protein C9374_013259 [Naegleria lovaniensis]|uniref:Rad50/SbcC-type AAA domain-containing protein n=1 Tax=Naegleria lovaniensis TaxID=51637 RepID=A0AA88H0Y4_NAELO|nr:uncharacterized protein C9374_013259 [Naegleria lovaniensis]KAG2391774.1 hypothetical protein C9374_013259 [Naegleria lovaniensis]